MGLDAPHLKRSIGLRTVVSTSAGLTFASSTFLVVVQIAYYLAGDSAWIAICIAGGMCALAAAAFSELNGMWPSVNGIRLYIHRAFGEKLSLVVALTYMTVVTFVVGAEAYVLSHVLSAAVPAIPPPWWIFLMLTTATAFNFRGLKVAGAFQDVITYSVVVSILVLSVLALARVHFQVPHPTSTGGIGPIFEAVGVAIFLFVGFEWVTPLADEVDSPSAIPVGMFIALGILVVAYSLITTAMFDGETSRKLLFGTNALRQATPHLFFAYTVFGSVGRWVMIATSICMSLTTFNAGLIGVSRFIYGMARDSVLPKELANISSRFNTPDRATLLVYLIALVISGIVYFTQKFILLVNLAAATESFIYAFAAAAVVALRLKDPLRERPFRMWGGILPAGLTALVFGLLAIGVFAQNGPDYWGSGIVLAAIAAGWWTYIAVVVHPRLVKTRADNANKRQSRRPKRDSEQ